MGLAMNRIREVRRRKGLKLVDVVALSGRSVSLQQLSRLERNERRLTWDMVCYLAGLLGCPATALVDDEVGADGPSTPSEVD